MPELTKDFIESELRTKSLRQIADENGTYVNKIRRLAQKLGVKLPDRGESYKKSLRNGRATPAMLGKKQSEDAKNKIGQSRHNSWEEVKKDPEKMEELRKTYRKTLENRPAWERQQMNKAAAKAIRATRTKGSKLERFLMAKLFDAGYNPQFHVKSALIQADLEIDIFLPDMGLAIEVDGVTHSEEVYGAEHLQKRKFADSKKNGLLLSAGYSIIRVDNTIKHVTKWFMNNTWERLSAKLEELKNSPATKGEIIYL